MKKPSTPTGSELPPEAPPRRKKPTIAESAPQFDAIFSGGYYIVYSRDDWFSFSDVSPTAAPVQKRMRKTDEMLQLATVTRQLLEQQMFRIAEDTITRDVPNTTRRDALLGELHTLLNKSGLIHNQHQQHLKNEIDVARQQVLRGGGIDDYALMQTIQEIASLQGLSAGGSVAGKFVADIINTPEPESAAIAHPVASAHPPSVFEEEAPDAFFFRPLEQFHAYDIAEIGGFRHQHSFFFARKLMKSLKDLDHLTKKEQDSSEIMP